MTRSRLYYCAEQFADEQEPSTITSSSAPAAAASTAADIASISSNCTRLISSSPPRAPASASALASASAFSSANRNSPASDSGVVDLDLAAPSLLAPQSITEYTEPITQYLTVFNSDADSDGDGDNLAEDGDLWLGSGQLGIQPQPQPQPQSAGSADAVATHEEHELTTPVDDRSAADARLAFCLIEQQVIILDL